MKNKESLSDRFIFWVTDLHPVFAFLGATVAAIIMLLAILIPFEVINYAYGVNGFGPVQEQVITVERLYVDGESILTIW